MARSLVGRVLLERYRVEAFVDAGGMGTVYRVLDMKRRVPLAMKVLKPEFVENPHVFKRFRREAATLQKLIHPNIVRFYGMYRAGNVVFLLENYIDGVTLREVLRKRRREGRKLSPQEVLGVLRAVSAALAYAQEEHGVVHCDIKPDNVMIDGAGDVFLTDFGIARHAESDTTTVLGAGTMAYMAPEQLMGAERVTPATDVYALGIMAYELLTGRRPFTFPEESTSARMARLRAAHLKMPPPDPRRFAPELPPEVSRVILRALEKDPARRYRNAWDFFVALSGAFGADPARVAGRVGSLAGVAGGGEGAAATLPPPPGAAGWQAWGGEAETAPQWPDDGRTQERRSPPWLWVAVVGAVLLLCVGVGGVLAVWAGRRGAAGSGRQTPRPSAAFGPAGAPEGQGSTGASGASVAPTLTPFPTYTPLPTYTPFPAPSPTPEARGQTWQPCPEARPSRLHVGMGARVTGVPALPNRVRAAPGLDKPRVGWLQVGEPMDVLGGPACASGMVWWKIRSRRSGLVGWTAEGDVDNYWLEPLP